eukprot:5366961-Pyramimonas_sp.AAC.1
MPCPRSLADVWGAEMCAATKTIMHKSQCEMVLVTGYRGLFTGWQAGRPYGADGAYNYAELWARLWESLGD